MSRVLSPQFVKRKFRRCFGGLKFQLHVFVFLIDICRIVDSCGGGGTLARDLPARCAHHSAHIATAGNVSPAIVVCDLEALLCGD